MMFKKSGGKIFGVVFTPKEQKAIDAEVSRQLIARHMEFADDVDYMILKILHDHFGFGPTRLRKFYERFMEENNALMAHYEMEDAGVYIARKEMNALGCNVEEWNKRGSE
jgi:hypothetical protein